MLVAEFNAQIDGWLWAEFLGRQSFGCRLRRSGPIPIAKVFPARSFAAMMVGHNRMG
jgi:hypothetical protein